MGRKSAKFDGTLYQLIATQGLTQVVSTFLERARQDEELAPYFEGRDINKISLHVLGVMVAILGEPLQEVGLRPDISAEHQPLHVPLRHFIRLLALTAQVLHDLRVREDVSQMIMDVMLDYKDQVVWRGKDEATPPAREALLPAGSDKTHDLIRQLMDNARRVHGHGGRRGS